MIVTLLAMIFAVLCLGVYAALRVVWLLEDLAAPQEEVIARAEPPVEPPPLFGVDHGGPILDHYEDVMAHRARNGHHP